MKAIFLKCDDKLFNEFKNGKLLMQYELKKFLTWEEYFRELNKHHALLKRRSKELGTKYLIS